MKKAFLGTFEREGLTGLSPDPYDIVQHNHRFAAWAAGRAASVKGFRFSVERGRSLLETCGLSFDLVSPDQLPTPVQIDAQHRAWRTKMKSDARVIGFSLTDGVAAKLINVYLKSRFVCGGAQHHPNVVALHPPIDRLLLDEMAKENFGGERKTWKMASTRGWSKLESDAYEDLISRIRLHLGRAPLWTIEKYWKGNQ